MPLFCHKYIKPLDIRQVVLGDQQKINRRKKRKRPWKDKKVHNEQLALAYEGVNPNKAIRLKSCANSLSFREMEDDMKKLEAAYFCHIRLCPMCAWRRSLKIFAQCQNVMQGMKSEKEYGYIFLTLTVKNSSSSDLSTQIDQMLHGWDIMMHRKNIKSIVKGWYRGLEVTHNTDINSPDYDSFHPHFHCIFAVNKSYFTNKTYLSQEKWTSLWKDVMKLNYTPIVDIRKVKGDTANAVAEVAKYTVKDDDYIIPDDWDLTVNTVRTLDSALANRRLVAYGGKMKDWHKKLNLDDPIDGDLIHIQDPDDSVDDNQDLSNYPLVTYVWSVGFNGRFDYYKQNY